MRYYIKVFGCQMNQSDAERIATILEKYEFKPAASIEAASLVVFVTCGVRQSAEDRVYGQINNIRKKYPTKHIVLTGCLAHRKDVRRRLKGKVNLFFQINELGKLEEKIKSEFFSVCKKIKAKKKNKPCSDYLQIIPRYASSYKAYVPIMTGCNNFCSYCVVPYAREREYSRPERDIQKEVKSLIKKNYREIVLLGQNVNSYTSGQTNFSKLLKSIELIPGHFWLTFLTSHPKDMSDELIEVISKSKKICEYISLPAQAGDNEILRRMNRKYTIEHYKSLVKKIRKAFLDVRRLKRRRRTSIAKKLPPTISTDIIVGFPGETKKQFENTAKLLRDVKFDMAYIAQYSPRPETAAWKMKDNVSRAEKVRREKVLTKILARTALANNKKYVGKIVEVLVDADGKGHTRAQKKIAFHSAKKIPVGSFVRVKITKAKTFGLEGEIKKNKSGL